MKWTPTRRGPLVLTDPEPPVETLPVRKGVLNLEETFTEEPPEDGAKGGSEA